MDVALTAGTHFFAPCRRLTMGLINSLFVIHRKVFRLDLFQKAEKQNVRESTRGTHLEGTKFDGSKKTREKSKTFSSIKERARKLRSQSRGYAFTHIENAEVQNEGSQGVDSVPRRGDAAAAEPVCLQIYRFSQSCRPFWGLRGQETILRSLSTPAWRGFTGWWQP